MNQPLSRHSLKPSAWIPIHTRPLFFEPDEAPLDEITAQAVLDSLLSSQNRDGGFGSFEKGKRSRSTALKTHAATEIILQSGITGRKHTLAVHPAIIGITDYLKKYPPLAADHPQTTWLASSNRSLAPWWKKTRPYSYHPFAALTGFSLAFSPRHLPLYERSLYQAGHLIRSFMEAPFLSDANAISSMQRLIEHINANHISVFDSPVLYNRKIRQQIALLATKNTVGQSH
ncbi:hypothetical protein NB640_10790 [Oxalobacter vibrioformis]|uniref:Uncharacterized protein n=1 Tax=Oxalobacter vibrioformis TaxID=933080 RepID=A0A9E9LY43_9BURK|nr:hypothetical protein [Oxalobacter vibrioformis]WAW09700.1 hypothetical protein NB640_10790 [Oxalobacter vibrioformis]